MLASVFVLGISSWYLLKKRELLLAKRSMVVAAVFGLVMSVFIVVTGDGSARLIARYQPVKFAAMENLYEGQTRAPLVAVGILKANRTESEPKREDFLFKIEVPAVLSYMAFSDPDAFVPGLKDLVQGNPERNIISTSDKIKSGKLAVMALKEYKEAKKAGNPTLADSALTQLNSNFHNFGYGFLGSEHEVVPPIKLTFYSFRIMVGLGFLFILLFVLALWLLLKNKAENNKWFYYLAIFSIPLAYLATQVGWIVAEVGRQPWIIQDVMPTSAAVSRLTTGSVQLTFVLFAVTFTVLLIAEIKIMLTQIKKGPKEGGTAHV